jgi:4-diphosphocytidyl-2-C-methyl-D-erythritol kinase
MSGQTRVLRALAPAKVNLGLFVGRVRAEDAKHELATVMQSISLADELTMENAPPGAQGDQLECPGVEGAPEENLAALALREFRRQTGWDGPPQLLRILKRIPVAGGLGGGSADAAAVLRLARAASGLGGEELLLEIAAGLGADVPAQVRPGRWLATGAGERLRALPPPRAEFGILVVPGRDGRGARGGARAWSAAAPGPGAAPQRPPASGGLVAPGARTDAATGSRGGRGSGDAERLGADRARVLLASRRAGGRGPGAGPPGGGGAR